MSEAASPSIVNFATARPETTTSKPDADRLLEGDPQHVARNYFSDSTGRLFAGIWESTRGRWRVRYTENEFCHITQRRVRIEDGCGNHWTFQAGDSFVIPAGFSGIWDVQEPIRKLYVIHEPSGA